MDYKKAFTVIELLIVILVIGILSSIVYVSFASISQRAAVSSIKSDLINASKILELSRTSSAIDAYPSSLSTAGAKTNPDAVTTFHNTANTKSYCIEQTLSGVTYSISSYSKSPAETQCIYNGLIGWWKFNGDANDSSGSGINGTVNGATLTTGQNGSSNGAYQLAETGRWINMGNPSAYSKLGSDGFTYSVWVKRTGTSTNQWPIIMGSYDTHRYFGIRTFNFSDTIGFEYGNPPFAGASWGNTSFTALPLNTWCHFAATYDGTNLSTYFNGSVLVSNVKAAIYSVYGGLVFSDGTYGWAGAVDDARVYNRGLSATEISQIYGFGAQ